MNCLTHKHWNRTAALADLGGTAALADLGGTAALADLGDWVCKGSLCY